MKYVIYFISTFLFVYMISYFFIVRKASKKIQKKIPVEVEYLITKYNIDLKKVNYRSFLNTISITGSIIIAITALIIFNIENILLQLLVAFIVIIPLILIGFKLIGEYYKKKGLIKDENKRNRK